MKNSLIATLLVFLMINPAHADGWRGGDGGGWRGGDGGWGDGEDAGGDGGGLALLLGLGMAGAMMSQPAPVYPPAPAYISPPSAYGQPAPAYQQPPAAQGQIIYGPTTYYNGYGPH